MDPSLFFIATVFFLGQLVCGLASIAENRYRCWFSDTVCLLSVVFPIVLVIGLFQVSWKIGIGFWELWFVDFSRQL